MKMKNRVKKVEDLGFHGKNRKYLCRCSCGDEFVMWASHFYRGSNGCKCQNRDSKKSRLYSIWINIKTRCNNENTPSYRYYGAKGVRICKEWEFDYPRFKSWAMSNGYRDDLSIDRIDNNGDYEPSNCRWADSMTQNNNKSNSLLIDVRGEVRSLKSWCRLLGLNYKTEHSYLSKNGMEKYLERLNDKAIWYIKRELGGMKGD